MLNDQDLCKQALGELRAACDHVVRSYDHPPLSLEKNKQPRVGREQLTCLLHQLSFVIRDNQGELCIREKDLQRAKENITKLPPMWHNQIDYTPVFDVLDKWIQVSVKNGLGYGGRADISDKIATIILITLVVLIALDFILMYKYPLQVNIANGVLFFFFIFMVVGAFSDKYKTRR